MIRQRIGRTRVSDTEDKLIIEEVRNGMVCEQVTAPLLPTRRPGVTMTMQWPPDSGKNYYLTIGFYPDTGRPAEVFLAGAKSGSDQDALLDDAMIAVSKLLQSGADPKELSHTFGGQSLIGAVALEIANV